MKPVLRCRWSRNVKHHSLLIRILTSTSVSQMRDIDGRRKQETMSFAGGEEEGTPFMPSFEPIGEEDLDIPAFLKKRTF